MGHVKTLWIFGNSVDSAVRIAMPKYWMNGRTLSQRMLIKIVLVLVDYHSPWMDRPMPKEYIGEGQLMLFEGKEYIVPSDVDSYLKHVYGDYMTLPPVEKRKGHASEFINYDRRITEAEAERIFVLLHEKYQYRVSLKSEIKTIMSKLGLRK